MEQYKCCKREWNSKGGTNCQDMERGLYGDGKPALYCKRNGITMEEFADHKRQWKVKARITSRDLEKGIHGD